MSNVIKLCKIQKDDIICDRCFYKDEHKFITSMVLKNSPCFTCLYNEHMPKQNNFKEIKSGKKTAPEVKVVPLKQMESFRMNKDWANVMR